jgi:LmbE family N-acetylglucosaminyl deacetylase
MKVFVIAAHPDDETFGCGGTLLKHAENNDQIYILFFTDGVSSRKLVENKNKLKKIKNRYLQSVNVGKKIGVKQIYREYFEDNQLDKVSLLNLVKVVERYKSVIDPHIVYTHFYNDLNIDHRKVSEATVTAFRSNKRNSCKKILFFETLSSTNYMPNRDDFKPNYFVDISKYIKKKLNLCKIYKDEIKKNQGRSLPSIKIQAQYRGNEANFKFAEAFQVYKIFQ